MNYYVSKFNYHFEISQEDIASSLLQTYLVLCSSKNKRFHQQPHSLFSLSIVVGYLVFPALKNAHLINNLKFSISMINSKLQLQFRFVFTRWNSQHIPHKLSFIDPIRYVIHFFPVMVCSHCHCHCPNTTIPPSLPQGTRFFQTYIS